MYTVCTLYSIVNVKYDRPLVAMYTMNSMLYLAVSIVEVGVGRPLVAVGGEAGLCAVAEARARRTEAT